MAKKIATDAVTFPRFYSGAEIPLRVIRSLARQIAEKFKPEKIILFGSQAYGTPHADSDVDILVIMPARNQLDQAFKIRLAFDPPFAWDLIVRTPKNIERWLADGESFSTEIMRKGKVLYEKGDPVVGKKSRRRFRDGTATQPKQAAFA
jgi:uncharacterized protein